MISLNEFYARSLERSASVCPSSALYAFKYSIRVIVLVFIFVAHLQRFWVSFSALLTAIEPLSCTALFSALTALTHSLIHIKLFSIRFELKKILIELLLSYSFWFKNNKFHIDFCWFTSIAFYFMTFNSPIWEQLNFGPPHFQIIR